MSKMGTLYFEIQEKIREIIRQESSNKYDPECNICVSHYGTHYPAHYASGHCKSGKRNHCTCNSCF